MKHILENRYHFAYLLLSLYVIEIHFSVVLENVIIIFLSQDLFMYSKPTYAIIENT